MTLVGLGAALAFGYGALPTFLYETAEQPLEFSHAIHMGEEGGMSCEDCHGFRADGSFVGIPPTSACADCHAEPMGESAAEKSLVENYLGPGKEIPWLVYSRQPDNVFFPHAAHVKIGKIECTHCHGDHGKTDKLRSHQRNKLTGYSRDIWGSSITGLKTNSFDRMKMDDCVACHDEHDVDDSCLMCHK
ncbi:MAG: cytochrome c3 family protein [Deltaproteobacteria bacterium]|nr:cytochrome c3 family protein [Deltaproteobacteria bacterium]